MNHNTTITSLQNPLVKQVVRLQQKASERAKSGLFIAEGRREVSLAISHGIAFDRVLISEEIYTRDPSYPIEIPDSHKITFVSRSVYNKLAYRKDAEGVIMVGVQKPLTLDRLEVPGDALILVLEGVEKPGNLGAIFRTADAAGVDALILADSATDIYNPNAIRASLGCVFTVPAVSCTTSDAIAWLNDMGRWPDHKLPAIHAAVLQTDILYYARDMKGPSALVFGAEDTGLSAAWREAAHQLIKIPMSGSIDSLNVGASVAVLCFEVRRQRHQDSAGLENK